MVANSTKTAVREYLLSVLVGYVEFERTEVSKFPPERVAQITGILAKTSLQQNTLMPTSLRSSQEFMPKQARGGQRLRAICCLPAPGRCHRHLGWHADL